MDAMMSFHCDPECHQWYQLFVSRISPNEKNRSRLVALLHKFAYAGEESSILINNSYGGNNRWFAHYLGNELRVRLLFDEDVQPFGFFELGGVLLELAPWDQYEI
jgi:hypothetical protein